jgi:hypothetical protein
LVTDTDRDLYEPALKLTGLERATVTVAPGGRGSKTDALTVNEAGFAGGVIWEAISDDPDK